ncbi:MAG TPA: energy transducer TonB [candidate division Zixibacteria bacterium]
MSKDIIISLSSHIVFILLLVIFVPVTAYYQIKGYPQVYRVGLISLPTGGMGGGKGEEVKATLGEIKKTEGIGLKEIKTEQKKKKQSKISQQKIELTKKSTPVSAKKDEGKSASAKEGAGEGYEISLGGGLGSAFVEGGDFESPYYLNIAFGRIRENFTNPLRQTNLPIRVTVYFIIQKSGKLVESKIETPSGIAIFDQSALRAVLSADPLPPLPQEYKGEWLGIHLEFEFLP